jgi:L-alanine-DL-glutamate epimerase-like enolase superfamily enzyme
VSSYERIAELPLEVESLGLEGLELQFSEEFTRATTLIELRGPGGETGVGEDVVYDEIDHVNLQADGPGSIDLAGSYTLDSFSKRLEETELFPAPPVRGEVSELYRRWAFESAALDLALAQAGRSLADVLEREPRPLNFVVSMRLGSWPPADEPEKPDRVLALLERYPSTKLKLDPTNQWTQELVDQLVATGAVDSLDLKGQYKGTPVDVETDPELYRMVIEAFPNAWLEDPDVTDGTRPILDEVSDRVTWDAPIHSVADVLELPWKPRMVNIKPSRFGPLSNLLAMYDWCEREGVQAYGGGQTELGPGRGHIQYLASIFHPDTPNDTAPSGYNNPQLPDGLLTSPLEPRIAPAGFRWLQ